MVQRIKQPIYAIQICIVKSFHSGYCVYRNHSNRAPNKKPHLQIVNVTHNGATVNFNPFGHAPFLMTLKIIQLRIILPQTDQRARSPRDVTRLPRARFIDDADAQKRWTVTIFHTSRISHGDFSLEGDKRGIKADIRYRPACVIGVLAPLPHRSLQNLPFCRVNNELPISGEWL